MKRPLYITATDEAVGKTLVTLGLVADLANSFDRVGFIKPLGIARVRAGVDGIDLDAMLIERACALHENIKDMCPVALSSAQWPVITKADAEAMLRRMQDAYGRISSGRDVVVVEGTGHATMGSSLGLSNAGIARMYGCKALIVAAYGVMGHNPFDPALLNAAYLRESEVDVIGLVINRVPKELLNDYRPYAQERLDSMGIRLLGILPEEPELNSFRFIRVAEVLNGEMICGAGNAERIIKAVRVGAMTPHRAIPYLVPHSLIITPGDREDMLVSICACAGRKAGGPAGVVLSAGERPHPRILELLKESALPTFLAQEDSYTVASKIFAMPVRIQPTDDDKITLAKQMVMEHVDLEQIVKAL
ncbi:MAG: AAA family ATPase [Planctomycetes bacterium]|nr:AAA family ATPase [Planctomycetota bacterium]